MSDYKRIAWDMVYVYLLSYITMFISFLIRALYARKLTVVDYGLFFGIFGFFFFFAFLRDWGLSSAALYYAKKYIVKGDNRKVKALYLISQGFTILMSLAIISLLYLLKGIIISSVYKNEGHISYIFDFFMLFWAVEIVFKNNIIFFETFQEQRISKFLEFVYRTLIFVLSYVGFIVLDSYKVPPLSYLAATIFISIVSTTWLYFRHKNIFSEKAYWGKDLSRELFTYGSMVILGGVASILLSNTDVFLIQIFLGAESVGYYVSGLSASDVITLILMPVSIILIPLFTQLWHEGNRKELANVSSFLFNNILIFTLPVSAFFFTFATSIIQFVFGDNFSGSVIILQLFSIFVLVKMTNTFLVQLLLAMGKPGLSSKITLYAALLNIVLDIILINILGNVGAAIATGISLMLMFILSLMMVKKELPIRFDLKNNLKIILSSGIFLALCFLLRGTTFISIAQKQLNFALNGGLVFVIAGVFYLIALFLLGVITKEKVMLVKNLFGIRFPASRFLR